MNLKRLFAAFLFVDFLALSLWAAFGEPGAAIWEAMSHNLWSVQLTVDLLIAFTASSLWIWRDAKERGLNPLPWVIAILCTGSLATLLYAALHGLKERPGQRDEASAGSAAPSPA